MTSSTPHSKSKKKRKAAILSLTGSIPDGEALSKRLIELGGPIFEASPDADRTAAIVGAAYLEYGLKKAICVHLKLPRKSPQADLLFDGDDAPLRDISARIKMAKALGILSLAEWEQIECMRRIRVAFAHSMMDISFHTEAIADLCASLAEPHERDAAFRLITAKFPDLSEKFQTNRIVFCYCVFKMYVDLSSYDGTPREEPPAFSFGKPIRLP